MSVVERVETLRYELNLYNYQYYVLNDPTVSDAIYDQLYMELVQLEKDNPALIHTESPTQRIGAGRIMDNRFDKVMRTLPMLSIENAFEADDIIEFVKKHKPSVISDGLCLEYKLDGLGIELLYKGGILTRATTRGDGIVGDDVTANCLAVDDIPSKIEHTGLLEVRGEIYMDKSTLVKLNIKRKARGKKLLANCRNAAAGGLKQKDPLDSRDGGLKFFCYGFGRGIHHNEITTQFDFLRTMNQLNIPSPEWSVVVHTYDEVIQHYNKLVADRDNIPYDIDGMVIKLNSLKEQASTGYTSKFPRGVIAYKFPASEGKTVINSITMQVGRTGAITPVAELEPIDLHGVIISRATLHNWDEIKRKDIRIKDYIMIQRAGDVIPAVVCSLPRLRTGDEVIIEGPTHCPVCAGPLQKDDAVYRCVNPNCRERLKRSLQHMVSRNALNIQGMGKSILNELVDLGIISKLSDVLYLTYDHLLKVDHIGDKKANNILDAIDLSIKNCNESRFLFSLGLRHVGADISKLLINKFDTVEAVLDQSSAELQKVPGIGKTIADIIELIAKDKEFRRTVKAMRDRIPVHITGMKETYTGKLEGKIFVITGSFDLSRVELKELLEHHGAKVTKAVSKKTNYILAGDKPGASKIKKAKEPTKIIGAKEFSALLK